MDEVIARLDKYEKCLKWGCYTLTSLALQYCLYQVGYNRGYTKAIAQASEYIQNNCQPSSDSGYHVPQSETDGEPGRKKDNHV